MRNSRGDLGDIPSPSRADAPPASARSRRPKASGEVFGPKGRPFRRRVIAASRTQTSSNSTPNRSRNTRSPRSLTPLRPGLADDVQRRPVPRRGWKWSTCGNGGNTDFREAAESHFQPICWRWEKSSFRPLIKRVRFAADLYGAFSVKRLFWVLAKFDTLRPTRLPVARTDLIRLAMKYTRRGDQLDRRTCF
jgi:hypothetical protein